ncbi:carboxylesterase family protein [Sarocladium implicatum]|nr:carboxylesterase family protein [Sarocladium implicatum]
MRCTYLLSLVVTSWLAIAAPADNAAREAKPVLDLPYGSFEATSKKSGIWTFKNIPYAAPPLGHLRWAKPAPPLQRSGTQPGNRSGPACLQSVMYGLNVVGGKNEETIGQLVNQILGSSESVPTLNAPQSEDCLYLDIQVPEKALRDPTLKLPVIVYVFGGGYTLGGKDLLEPLLPLYDGSGMIKQSGKNIIFISFNYRLGALGFLAGTTMERDGLPNTGLWDQRAVFEWVQAHISKVGGDPAKVTAIGESAGASSLMFHLVAEGGTLDPLFQKAVLLSPAYQPIWDRSGTVEGKFELFADLAGCKGEGVECLREASSGTLAQANKAVMELQTPGTFAFGPTPDGFFIRQLPTIELSLGKIWPVESLILSHCEHESILFVSGAVQSNDDFGSFLTALLPNSSLTNGITERILETYPPVGGKSSLYKAQTDRLEDLLRDASMTCNIRYLTEAIGSSRVWAMQYSVKPGWHATDLIPLFYNDDDFDMSSLTTFLASVLRLVTGIFMRGLSRAYQSYVTSYVRTGDPNTHRLSLWENLPYPGTTKWRHPQLLSSGKAGLGRVLDVDYGLLSTFTEIEDGQMPMVKCGFWPKFAMAATVAGGKTDTDIQPTNIHVTQPGQNMRGDGEQGGENFYGIRSHGSNSDQADLLSSATTTSQADSKMAPEPIVAHRFPDAFTRSEGPRNASATSETSGRDTPTVAPNILSIIPMSHES